MSHRGGTGKLVETRRRIGMRSINGRTAFGRTALQNVADVKSTQKEPLNMIDHPIQTLLRSRWLFHVSALVLTFIYWWSGLTKLFNFAAAQAEMSHFGLNPPGLFAALTIAVQLGGSALIITGSRWAWLGAGALAVFTLATIPLAHRFWEMEGLVAVLDQAIVHEHISVIGGLALAAILSDIRRSKS